MTAIPIFRSSTATCRCHGSAIWWRMAPHGFRVQIRQYPRAGGVTWRWWVFDRGGGTHLDSGVIVGGNREQAERAASDAIERMKWSPERSATTSYCLR